MQLIIKMRVQNSSMWTSYQVKLLCAMPNLIFLMILKGRYMLDDSIEVYRD